MKIVSRYSLTIIGLAFLLACGLAVTAEAQNREKYIISAKAGGVNFVAGNVTVERKGDDRWQLLSSTDDLQTGDRVTTGAGGRVEVLLNPGSYMRVNEDSVFELIDASLNNLIVRLSKGSAVLEVTGADDVALAIGITTPQATTVIVKGGIYRFNILTNETTEVIVRKGRVLCGRGTVNEVKGGNKALIRRGGNVEVAKLNKKEQDTLDLWSKERAQTLARANQRLQRRPLLTAFNDQYGWGQYGSYGSSGLWVYSSIARSYCFLPFGLGGWSSPYGHHYGNGFGYGNSYDGSRVYGQPQTGNNGGTQPSGNGTNGGNGSNPTTSPAPVPPPSSPPSFPAPSQPMPSNDLPIERGPRREYTTQPN
jgi:hypothetical protein